MRLGLQDRRWIEERARAAGFDLSGIASVPPPSSPESSQADQRFAEWVAAGHAGEMEYLKRRDEAGGLVRGDLRRPMPWARSVIVCAVNYNMDAPLSTAPASADTGWIARYAWSGIQRGAEGPAAPDRQDPDERGSDYHDVLLPKLRQIEEELRQRFAGACGGEPPLQTRCYVDTGPLLERGYAVRAGIGWIGRNTCVIHQQQGSWLLLGVIVTSLELEEGAWSVAAADRCGTCTRCIDACPTGALFRPVSAESAAAQPPDEKRRRGMDASRCVAYLTIEQKGSIDPELRGRMGRQVFGCDICQDVCPWNSRRPMPATSMLPARRRLINPELEWLASLDGPAFNRWFRGSPLGRTRRKRILRNVAIAMGNSGQAKFLPRLLEWSASEDPVLADVAAWAAERLREGSPDSLPGTAMAAEGLVQNDSGQR